MRRLLLAVCLAVALAGPAPGQTVPEGPFESNEGGPAPTSIPKALERRAEVESPLLRWMVHPLRRGMFINLPVVDTDPNGGTEGGLMPVWVLQGPEDDHIRAIVAPSVTFNHIFGWNAAYRHYGYPSAASAYDVIASASQFTQREVTVEGQDADAFGRGMLLGGLGQYLADGTRRFYGVGPGSSSGNQTSYTLKTLQYSMKAGHPILPGGPVEANAAHHLAFFRVAGGTVNSLPDLRVLFPKRAVDRWRRDSELELSLDCDTRDASATPTRGSYAKLAFETSQRELGSELVYERYTADLRYFHRHEALPFTTAVRYRFGRLVGTAPFYIYPSLGGKDSLRAYGDGRYVDRGMMSASLEERMTVWSFDVAGVSSDLEVAPFFEAGAVFHTEDDLSGPNLRPAAGLALRAVSRPQVVGSIDIGIGREGPAVFVDIDYPF